ncbi:hypothetical protein [Streptomyces acidicola]|uniref:hypothetical protein n=1 Tax=Streptomyces acidicola TaxID=2596892 RepID=UPI00381D8071
MTELRETVLGDPAQLPGRSLGGRLFGALLLLVALGICAAGVNMMLTAAGVQGMQGTLTVERCWKQDRSGKAFDEPRCSGTFRPDGGGEPVENAEYRGGGAADVAVGQKLDVHEDGPTYKLSGGKGLAQGVMAVFGGLAFSALAVPFLATGIQPRWFGRGENRTRVLAMVTFGIKGTTAGRVRNALLLVGLAGMLVSYFAYATMS